MLILVDFYFQFLKKAASSFSIINKQNLNLEDSIFVLGVYDCIWKEIFAIYCGNIYPKHCQKANEIFGLHTGCPAKL